jgi:hypothetical protein
MISCNFFTHDPTRELIMVAIRQTWKEIHQKCQAYENGDLAGRQLPVTREKRNKRWTHSLKDISFSREQELPRKWLD